MKLPFEEIKREIIVKRKLKQTKIMVQSQRKNI